MSLNKYRFSSITAICAILLLSCAPKPLIIREINDYHLSVVKVPKYNYCEIDMILNVVKQGSEVEIPAIKSIMDAMQISLVYAGKEKLFIDIQQAMRIVDKYKYYIILKTNFMYPPPNDYLICFVTQDQRKAIAILDLDKSGVKNQGLFHPFTGGNNWALETINNQKYATRVFDLHGTEIPFPVFKM